MPNRAHFLKNLVDAQGNILIGCVVRVLDPGLTSTVTDTLWTDNTTTTSSLGNPFTCATGVVSFYLDTPRRIRLGVTPPGSNETFFEDLDVLLQEIAIDTVTDGTLAVSTERTVKFIGTGGIYVSSANDTVNSQAVITIDGSAVAGLFPEDRNLSEAVSTVAAGLPPFINRLAGDLHTNTTDHHLYVLTGSGTYYRDSFPYPDGTTLNAQPLVGGGVWVGVGGDGSGPVVLGGHATYSSASNTAVVNVASAGSKGVQLKYFLQGAASTNNVQIAFASPSVSPFGATGCYWSNTAGLSFLGNAVANSAGPYPATTSVGQSCVFLVQYDATAHTVKVYQDGTLIENFNVSTFGTPTGTYVGFTTSSSGGVMWVDDFAVTVWGSYAWTQAEQGTADVDPMYLEGIVAGAQTVATNILPPGLRVPEARTVTDIYVAVGTAPTGAALNVTVKKNNTTTLGTVSIAAGATTGHTGSLSAAVAANDRITVDVTQIGSTIAGSDLAVSVVLA